VWGIYMAGSRIGFERGEIELHHVLATRAAETGPAPFPLRPDWRP
jgi:cyclopropane-fatty-acyl-phospholipid synthase